MKSEELKAILRRHTNWLLGNGGVQANLRGANLWHANLRGADLQDANLWHAYLRGANLWHAYLRGANLRGADLRGADLQGADLQGADLQGADLQGADLWGIDLRGVCPLACPDEGAFIGWKKCRDGVIVKLQIPSEAKRSSATGRKCRCDRATVLEIVGAEEAVSTFSNSFVYRAGETVVVEDFCEDRWNECAPGIHFFITRKEAEEY